MFKWMKHILRDTLLRLFRSTPAYSLKIIQISGSPSEKNVKIHYQICGKSAANEETPENLIYTLAQVQGFSPEDSKLILGIFVTEREEPELKIRNITFYKDTEEFKIEDMQNHRIFTLTANDIFSSHSLFKKFNSNDLISIHYSLLSQQQRLEDKSINQQIRSKKIPNLYVINDKK